MKRKKYVIYVKRNFAMIKIMKKNLKTRKKSDNTVITTDNLEELLLVYAI